MKDIAHTWIAEGKATLLPLRISTEFREYINALPWVGSTLEWSRLQPFATIKISQASSQELLVWIRSTELGACSHMALCSSPKEPCLLVTVADGIGHLDELFWASPGVHFCFGVDVGPGAPPRPNFAAILQYGAGDLVFARSRLS
jgi:hypothetical protein